MSSSKSKLKILKELSVVHDRLKTCALCPNVSGSPVHAHPIATPIMALGQAPGIHEAKIGKPFAFTAGKTLFKWLKTATDLDEAEIREKIYFSAVARCFPGKATSGSGDREPSITEIDNCRIHVKGEVHALQPQLLLVIGRVALTEVLGPEIFSKKTPLHEVVGKKFSITFHGVPVTAIPLPHPSGVSRWPQTEPGKTQLAKALKLIRKEIEKLA